jgi:integral membrane sensor domain MASE1
MGLAAGFALGLGCGGGPKPEPRPAAEGESKSVPAPEAVSLALSLDKGSYAVGERVRVRLVATNATGREVTLRFPSAQRFDLVVRRAGRVVWQWSADMMFAQALASQVLAAGDSLVFEAEWDQSFQDGTNPVLGAYTVQGVVKALPELATEEKTFGIVD